MTPAEQLTQEVTERRAEVTALSHLWEVVLGECPSQQQFFVWLDLHTFDRLVRAIRETGRKQSKRQVKMDSDHLVRFCSSVANQRKTEEGSPKPLAS
jgi:hypothetical protein